MAVFDEIKTACRTFLHVEDPLAIHVIPIRGGSMFMVINEDAYELHTGDLEILNQEDLEKKYGRILVKFKKGDKVALTEECKGAYGLDSSESDFYVVDVLSREYPYNIVVGNNKFGTDWNEFFSEDEITLKEKE